MLEGFEGAADNMHVRTGRMGRMGRLSVRSVVARTFVLVVGCLVLAGQASAFEAFDGRLQAHGFFESQLRVISADFGEDWDVTQWYNIFHLELELDIAPDGVGPFDLLSAYIGAEVRFDCIYSHGCGMFRSMNAFGDSSQSRG